MAASTKVVMHGRRKGSVRARSEGDLSQVAVLPASEWQRMERKLESLRSPPLTRAAQIQRRKESLHEHSKKIVKNWENTIEGQRLKRLQAHKIREEQEENERLQIDEEEAAFQAEERKKAIERAKTLLYYQTDRVKNLHSGLLLSEVLRERDAQVEYKKKRQGYLKVQEEKHEQTKKEKLEADTKADLMKAKERSSKRGDLAQFNLKQAADKMDGKLRRRLADLEDQHKLDKEAVEFQNEKKVLVLEEANKQKELRRTLDALLEDKKERVEKEKQEESVDEERIRIFTEAKKKMAKLRKEKEKELYEELSKHQEFMRNQLESQRKQEASNEDERIQLAVQEQIEKREAELREKQEKYMEATRDIHRHMLKQMVEKEQQKKDQELMEEQLLEQKMIQDQKFHHRQLERQRKFMDEALALQQFLKSQTKELKARKQEEKDSEMDYTHKNLDLLKVEEAQFQQYAGKVMDEVKQRGGLLKPLHAAAKEGAGGGHGPVLLGVGVRPSYKVHDATDEELPSYTENTVGTKTATQKRLGFIW